MHKFSRSISLAHNLNFVILEYYMDKFSSQLSRSLLSNNRTVAILLSDTIQLIDLEKITSPRAKRSSLIKNQNLIIEERCIKPRSSNGVLQQPIKKGFILDGWNFNTNQIGMPILIALLINHLNLNSSKYSEITKIGFGFTEFSKPYILMQLSPRNHKHHVSRIRLLRIS